LLAVGWVSVEPATTSSVLYH